MSLCQEFKQKWLEVLENLEERKELLEKAFQTEDFNQRFTLAKEILAKQIKALEVLKELMKLKDFFSKIWFQEPEFTEFSKREVVHEFIEREKEPYSFRALCPAGPDIWAVATDYKENGQLKAKLFIFQIKEQKIKPKEEIEIPEGYIDSLAYFPNKDLFLIGYDDKLISLARKENGEFEIKKEIKLGRRVYAIIPFPDNSFVAKIGDQAFYFPNIENLENNIGINTEGTFAIRATENKGIFYNKGKKLYFRSDPSTKETEIVEHRKNIFAISNYLAEEKVLVIGDDQGSVRLVFFDPETGKKELKPEYTVHVGEPKWLHLTKKDDYYYLFSIGGWDNTLKLTKFDLQGKMAGNSEILIQFDNQIHIFFFDLDGNLIALDRKSKLHVLFAK